MYDYHARFYDPLLGRFISADTIVPDPVNPQDFNRYTYVRNNPHRYIDPTGHQIDWQELGKKIKKFFKDAGDAISRASKKIREDVTVAVEKVERGVNSWWESTLYDVCSGTVFIPLCEGRFSWSPPRPEEVAAAVARLSGVPIPPEDVEYLRRFGEAFQAGVHTWNQFQAATSGAYRNRAEAAVGWETYKQSNQSEDILVIGRLPHTAQWAGEEGYRILDIEGWTMGVNDAWVQGGIDRGATFRLASPQTHENLWDEDNDRPRVYAREIQQLLLAGYTQQGDYMVPSQ